MEKTERSPGPRAQAPRRWLTDSRWGQLLIAIATLPACGILIGWVSNIVRFHLYWQLPWPSFMLIQLVAQSGLASFFFVVGASAMIDLILSFERKTEPAAMR